MEASIRLVTGRTLMRPLLEPQLSYDMQLH
jgi:hypothetical protein